MLRVTDGPTKTLAECRERFPVFEQRTYLASQCLGPFPRDAHRGVEEYVRGRELHNRTLGAWLERLHELCALIERLLHAPPGSVGLRDSATACQAAVISSIVPLRRRNRIVISEFDFHSAVQLYEAQWRRGFDVHTVRSRDGMRIEPEDIVAAIDERTAVVAVSLVSRYNALLDVKPIIERAHQVGAIVVLDAYQAVGVVPLDVASMGVDVLLGGHHKWLSGTTGLAFVYVEPELCERLQPVYPGWLGHADFDDYVHLHNFDNTYVPRRGAKRFQQGTPAMPSVYASRAGLEFVLDVGVEAIRAQNLALIEHLRRGTDALGLESPTPREPEQHSSGLCLRTPDPAGVVEQLEARGIDVDQRRGEVVRVAPHGCSTVEDCDVFLAALAEILNKRQSQLPA